MADLIMGLDHVLIEAPEGYEAKARSFFGDFLGLGECPKPPALQARGGVWFDLPDGRQLHIGVASDFVARKKGHPALRCLDLETFKAHCDQHNVPFKPDDSLETPRVFIEDPFGNRLEVLHNQS